MALPGCPRRPGVFHQTREGAAPAAGGETDVGGGRERAVQTPRWQSAKGTPCGEVATTPQRRPCRGSPACSAAARNGNATLRHATNLGATCPGVCKAPQGSWLGLHTSSVEGGSALQGSSRRQLSCPNSSLMSLREREKGWRSPQGPPGPALPGEESLWEPPAHLRVVFRGISPEARGKWFQKEQLLAQGWDTGNQVPPAAVLTWSGAGTRAAVGGVWTALCAGLSASEGGPKARWRVSCARKRCRPHAGSGLRPKGSQATCGGCPSMRHPGEGGGHAAAATAPLSPAPAPTGCIRKGSGWAGPAPLLQQRPLLSATRPLPLHPLLPWEGGRGGESGGGLASAGGGQHLAHCPPWCPLGLARSPATRILRVRPTCRARARRQRARGAPGSPRGPAGVEEVRAVSALPAPPPSPLPGQRRGRLWCFISRAVRSQLGAGRRGAEATSRGGTPSPGRRAARSRTGAASGPPAAGCSGQRGRPCCGSASAPTSRGRPPAACP